MWIETLKHMLFQTKAVRFDTYPPPARPGALRRMRWDRGRPHSRDYDLNLWMNEMYEWGVRVREDIVDLESLLAGVAAGTIPPRAVALQAELRRLKRTHGRLAPDPGDPPPPPKDNE